MKVLVTGGAGFIGSNLAHHWVREHPDDEVAVYDALTYAGRRESLADLESADRIQFLRGDVLDADRLAMTLPGFDLVIHLAAESHNDRAFRDPLRFVSTNVLGTATLLEACRKAEIGRLHHVSTDEVYGSLALTESRRFREGSPYAPRGPYSASKAGSDHLVRAWFETYGLPVTLSNCGNNFGPYQYPEKLIPLCAIRLLRGDRIQLYGDGQNVRDWIFVEDHCRAIDLIAHKGRLGQTYLVSAGVELSNQQIAERLLALFGRPSEGWDLVADRPGHDRRYALDSTILREELGWTPAHEFDTALRATVDWYRLHRSWWEPLYQTGG